MSGSAGGSRIERKDVQLTVSSYIQTVLQEYEFYQDSVISGSYNTSEKKDFGDIDLIVQLNGTDKKKIKEHFSSYLSSLPESVIVPFKNSKYKSKRFLNTGEIVTVLYPVPNTSSFVQIDNIISLSSEETDFKLNFLNIPASKQGLMLGLIRTIILEDPLAVKKYYTNEVRMDSNQELEFVLSSSRLSLRLVTLLDDYKTVSTEEIWSTTNWNVVEELLNEYDLSLSFEELALQIKNKLQYPRSINRIKGIFRSMISIKSGEVDTPKGLEKQNALDFIAKL
jgi:hypothetical protein